MLDIDKKNFLDKSVINSSKDSCQNRWCALCRNAFWSVSGLLVILMLTGCWAMGKRSRTDVLLGPMNSEETEIDMNELRDDIENKGNGPTAEFESIGNEQE